jgi:putative transposase
MRLTGFCLLSNHFHLLLWPHEDGDLSRWMQWLMTSHVRCYHRHHKGSGHVWQGRFKAFPVQSDEHYLTVLRFVEPNPLRAKMVDRSQDWQRSSLKPTARSEPDGPLYACPILKPARWTRQVNGVEAGTELKALRHSFARAAPFGDTHWQTKTLRSSALNLRFDRKAGQSNRKRRTSLLRPQSVPLINAPRPMSACPT